MPFDPSKVLYFSLTPAEDGDGVYMQNYINGDYVTREAFEMLLELYREATEECKHCGKVRSSHFKGYYNRIFCFDELTQFEAKTAPQKHWAIGQIWRDPNDESDYLIENVDGYPNTMITLRRTTDGAVSTLLWALAKDWTLHKPAKK